MASKQRTLTHVHLGLAIVVELGKDCALGELLGQELKHFSVQKRALSVYSSNTTNCTRQHCDCTLHRAEPRSARSRSPYRAGLFRDHEFPDKIPCKTYEFLGYFRSKLAWFIDD